MSKTARALSLAVFVVAGCRSACGKSTAGGGAATSVQTASIAPPRASAPSAPDIPGVEPLDAGAAAEPFLTSAIDSLSFDAAGRTLRIVSDTIRIYDVATTTLRAEHPIPGSVQDGAMGSEVFVSATETPPVHWLVEISTGRKSVLPSSWFVEKNDQPPPTISLSDRGDRLAATETGFGRLTSLIYDTNTRERVTTVTQDVGTPAGGMFGGDITPDGRHVEWCWTRGTTCTLQDLEGGPVTLVARFATWSPKWTIEVPAEGDEEKVQPLRVLDASGHKAGKLDVPIRDAPHPSVFSVAICRSVDRAVVVRVPHLWVVSLPDGRRLLTKDIAGEADARAVVACAPDGTHVAFAVADGEGEHHRVFVEALPR